MTGNILVGLRRKALYVFVNTLTADEQYSLLKQPIPARLSEKQKAFFKFFLTFSKFRKKMTFIADLLPKLRTPKNVVRYLSKKSRFKGPFDRQHGKRVQTLLRSEQQQLLPYLVIILKVIESEKVCFSQKKSLIRVC